MNLIYLGLQFDLGLTMDLNYQQPLKHGYYG